MTNFRKSTLAPSAALVATALAACTSVSPGEAPPAADVQQYAGYLHVTASPRTREEVKDIWSVAEYILAPHNAALAPHDLVITPASVTRLLALGVPLRVEPDDVQSMINASSQEVVGSAGRPHAASDLFGPWFAKVQQLDAINAYLDQLVSLSNGRATLSTIGNSVQGRPIKVIRISSTPAGAERASILVTGTQHAREWASPMVTVGLIDALIRRYDVDPDVKKVIDTLDVYIVPVVNPDGYVATYNGQRLQRKNMNPKCNVDLNRNWDIWWGMGTPVNGCNEETYPGVGAFSEPETQALKQFTSMHKQIRLGFDYHSAAQQVGYPYAFNKSKPPGYDKEKAWAGLYSDTLKSVNGNVLPAFEDYDIGLGEGGSAIDWYAANFAYSLEVELRDGGSLGGFGLPDSAVVSFADENWAAWLAVALKLVEESAAPGPGTGGPDGGAGAGSTASDASSPIAGNAGASGGGGGSGGVSGAAGLGGTAGTAGTAGTGGAAGALGTAGMAAGSAGGAAAPPPPSGSRAQEGGGGCACELVSDPGAAVHGRGLWAAGLALVTLMGRRRPRRRKQ